jgi:hypothetical protein
MGGNAGASAPAQPLRLPEWVTRGSVPAAGQNGSTFFGVGTIWGMGNAALARSTASNRARAEVAMLFERFVAELMKGFYTAGGPGAGATEEQTVGVTISTFVSVTLAGTEIIDTLRLEDGTVFALAGLGLDRFVANLDSMTEAPEAVRTYSREQAAGVFAQLAAAAATSTLPSTGPCRLTLRAADTVALCGAASVPAGAVGELSFPCSGGPAAARVGTLHLTGVASDGYVDLRYVAAPAGGSDCEIDGIGRLQGVPRHGRIHLETRISSKPFECGKSCYETARLQASTSPP